MATGRPNDSAAWLREITRRGQARKECSLPLNADPAYFRSVPVWAAVAPHQPRLVVPRFNGSFRNRPDAICQRAGDSMRYSCLCSDTLPHRLPGRQALLPTGSLPCLASRSNPLGGPVRRSRRTAGGLRTTEPVDNTRWRRYATREISVTVFWARHSHAPRTAGACPYG